MEDLRNCFELNKQTMIKMFDAMAKAEHGYKQAYTDTVCGRCKAHPCMTRQRSVCSPMNSF